MEATTSQACKFILTTYNDGKNNKFYDSTFRVRPPFKPNANGQYKITINECLFNNNEPTLLKDKDYLEFEFEFKDDTENAIERFTINRDVITNSKDDDIKIINSLKYLLNMDNYLTQSPEINPVIKTIEVYEDIDGIKYDINNPYLKNSAAIYIFFEDRIDVNNVKSVKLRYSTNYGYLLNDLRSSDILGNINIDSNSCSFKFENLRAGGPYLYVLKTPLQSTVPTYNAINQGYNVVACVYNTLGYHNQVVQMCSSMEVVSNDLSNLRIELVNDQYEQVLIKSPMYIQITVSNE